MKFSILSSLVLFTLLINPVFGNEDASENSPNVLFIAIDDMNDWVGFLDGHPQAKTPNMDRLAKRGVNFTNAHCIAPACSPCRLGLLLGIEPFHSGLYPFYDQPKIPASVLSKYTSLPRLFRKNGYQTFGAGKIFHGVKENTDDWDHYRTHTPGGLNRAVEKGYQQNQSSKMSFCPTTNPLSDHPDYQVADYGIKVIEQQHDQPFFLAVGIVKPHLPFICPQPFFDMQAETIQPPSILANDLQDVPWVGRSMAKLGDDFKFRKDKSWEKVHRAYLACNSWADYNVGRVVDALQTSQYADNTIIVLWSDHGYHQGEKRSFRKFSLWEESTRVPFIILDPRPGQMKSGICKEAVSLINIYRTLGELTGIEVPKYVDGTSLLKQIRNPATKVASPAITTWGRGNYSLRDDQWRYTRYFDGTEELYDHRSDPNEWNNLAESPEAGAIKQKLTEFFPKNEAALVETGISLWNSVDSDQPEKLQQFKKNTWSQMKKKLKPKIE